MQTQAGDSYLRDLAAFIRKNDKALAESGFYRRRRAATDAHNPYLPFAWLSPSLSPPPPKPVLLSIDTHHLFYVLIRLEALGYQTGSLDVHVDSPSRPMSYASFYSEQKDSETLSLASFRSSFSMVSNISLGGSWWSRYDPPTIDAELKFIYSSFTMLPALAISSPGKKAITELTGESLDHNAVPLDVFKNLQRLECDNIDPRTLLGWDLLSMSLKSLKIRKSGLQDITDVFVGAVLDDQARREGKLSQDQQRRRNTAGATSSIPPPQSSLPPIQDEPEVEREQEPTSVVPMSPVLRKLSPSKWASIKHLYLPDNGLTFIPAELLLYLTSITHLDLSSNLFVSVPPGLEELYNLTSLNLSDNLIDSVLGIYLNLGQLIYLNISHNRLESLCGLERLLALERIDLRDNLLEESSEIGRLVVLPNISELWVEGNPFIEIEESYRINCFNYFWKEGKDIILDGTQPTMYERRNLSAPEHTKAILPPSTSSSAPVITIEPSHGQLSSTPPFTNEATSKASPPTTSDSASVVSSARRQKKSKRIVNLDATLTNQIFPSTLHSRLGSVQVSGPQEASSLSAISATHNDPPAVAELSATANSLLDADALKPRRSRHGRHHTEHTPFSSLAMLPEDKLPNRPLYSPLTEGNMSNMLLSRSEARKARQSASVFEPSVTVDDEAKDVEAYRKTIESLKKDMGDSWLKVYNQTQS
ncbi:hypothetical protein BDN70DRAFT_879778 [Pholiota conissans]|uniref:Leucine-rich repeat-containing protein n=1 Tax=Pholiota conissans TaxID=109636 RepID=A0A9P6CZR9_9AGAR|nr:hypothetical protein BDN70DRAFT_879778 [Pholiota conissans]